MKRGRSERRREKRNEREKERCKANRAWQRGRRERKPRVGVKRGNGEKSESGFHFHTKQKSTICHIYKRAIHTFSNSWRKRNM